MAQISRPGKQFLKNRSTATVRRNRSKRRADLENNSRLALATLVTSSNSSAERLNSRASWIFRRSPNISHELAESLLLLKSLRRASANVFDCKLKELVLKAYNSEETAKMAGDNDVLDMGNITFSQEDEEIGLNEDLTNLNVTID